MKVFDQTFFKNLRLSLAKGNQTARSLCHRSQAAKCSRTVCTERCKYPVSALAERGCKADRVVGGRHRIYYNFDITKCAIDYALMIVNIPFPLWRNADVNPRGILGDGTEYITSLILLNVPSFLLCKAFSLRPFLQKGFFAKIISAKEKALNGFRGGVRLWITCNLVVGEAWGIS